MGFFDRLLGREPQGNAYQQGYPQRGYPQPGHPQAGQWQQPGGLPPQSADEQAIARYQYLLRTAPPERIEQVHAEAFSKLTPQQRGEVLRRLSHDLPPGEAPRTDDPQALARAATRAEMNRPGYLGQAFGGIGMGGMGMGVGMGMGGMLATSLLGSIAGSVIGSAIAHEMMGGFDSSPEAAGLGGFDGGPVDGVGADGSFVDGGPFAGGDQGFGDQGGLGMDDASGFMGGDGGFDLGGGDGFDFGGGDGFDFGGGDFGGDF